MNIMRLTITFKAKNGGLRLPINHQEVIQGFVYRSLENTEFATFLHDNGFTYEKRSYKLFTFSRLNGKYSIRRDDNTIYFSDKVMLSISSVVHDFTSDLSNKFLLSDDLYIAGQPIVVEEVTTKVIKDTGKTNYRIKMLSPITVYSTYENAYGAQKTEFYTPDDPLFSEMIEQNFIKKYTAYHETAPQQPISIRPYKVSERNKVVAKYKNLYITGWTGLYDFTGPFEAIQFLYDSGLGAKNSQGFGMFEWY